MDVEIKLRLPDAAAHWRLVEALAPSRGCTHLQENYFFDGAGGELSSRGVVLAARFNDGDASCVLVLKSNLRLEGGVSRVEMWLEDNDPDLVRPCVADPRRLVDMARGGSSRFMRRLAEELLRSSPRKEELLENLVCLGGFRNVRRVHRWKGLKLDVDETHYDFGTRYEVECETTEPEKSLRDLELFLKEKEIPYKYSEATKFQVFVGACMR